MDGNPLECICIFHYPTIGKKSINLLNSIISKIHNDTLSNFHDRNYHQQVTPLPPKNLIVLMKDGASI